MSSYPMIVFFVLFSFATSLEITVKQFTDWQCTNMCTKPDLEQKVAEKCAEFVDPTLHEAYKVDKIKSESKCKNTYVALKADDSDNTEYEFLNVGLCYLSKTVSKCITTGENPSDMIVWTRSNALVGARYFDVCFPTEIKSDEL